MPRRYMTAKLVADVEEYVRSELKTVDCSHDWNHIFRVRRNALNILALERDSGRFKAADDLVVEVAALMHDIGDFKYTKDHSAGPNMTREFLSSKIDLGISADQIERVALIIGNISFRHELGHGMNSALPEELRIVQDADRLDAIGAVGVARCFAFSGARGTPFYRESEVVDSDFSVEKYNQQSESNGSSAVTHFYEKLFKLKDMMKTETGKVLAVERHAFMVQYIQTIEKECGLASHPISQ